MTTTERTYKHINTSLYSIRYCCGKQCEVILNQFLIRDLHNKLDLLCHLPLSSIIDDKIRPPPPFSTPWRKNFDPPPRLSTPHLKKYFDPSTSFWTIRTLYNVLAYRPIYNMYVCIIYTCVNVCTHVSMYNVHIYVCRNECRPMYVLCMHLCIGQHAFCMQDAFQDIYL